MILLNKISQKLILLGLISTLGGCAVSNPTLWETGLAGGVAGAGTGALVGHLIEDGNIAASAGLGALIGLPAGLAIGQYYVQHLEEQKLAHEKQAIKDRQIEIFNNERQLEDLRNEIRGESVVELDRDRRNVQFDGETLGSFYR
jgi:hypothetical protein